MNIKLEKFNPLDFDLYYLLVSDIQIMAMVTERGLTIEEAKSDFDETIINNELREEYGTFKIFEQDSGTFLGLAKLEIKKLDDKEAELGYLLLPAYWGRGIASMVSSMLIEVALNDPQIEVLTAIIDPKNLASRKVLIKNQFESREFKDFEGLPGEILERKLKY
ncbi:GNAT family N-acetyltransferase [Sphingobacterium sp. CZ-2]|uniref:GNAT family N-acetyltransferase n=1 Tax=Sphingobacterium sp. CZ-2 TaxID=2557994 RepID=UPI00106F33DC|nr:GNAT family N-acetyltransferase [Sphingobacterium sp. CZ-2]QBR13143.1 N-acetyltransferase [Sphingobacterium sp. CZ-2]